MKKCLFLLALVMFLLPAALPAVAADRPFADGDSAVYFSGEPRFLDQDQIDHQLAIAVLAELGVIDGYRQAGGGYIYDPDRVVTRAEMAKIISVIATGGQDVAADQHIAAGFKDVPETYWGRPYVAYCAARGIISGRGDGYFYPEDPVKGTEALKMLLVLLGCEPETSGLLTGEWERNTLDLARAFGLLTQDGGVDTAAGCDRDTMGLLAYRALFANKAGGTQNLLAACFGQQILTEIDAYIAELLTPPKQSGVVHLSDLPLRTELIAFIDASTAYRTEGGYSCDAYDQDGNKLLRFIFEQEPDHTQVAVYKILGSGKISFFDADEAEDYLPCPAHYTVELAAAAPSRYTVRDSGTGVSTTLIVKDGVPVYDVRDSGIEEIDEMEAGDQFYLMRSDSGRVLAIFVTYRE